jgi:hypothetical protein
MGTIELRSIIPHSPTHDSRLPTPYHSGVTGIDINGLKDKPHLPNFGTNFRMIKASNVILSVVPIKLTDFRTSLTDIAPIIEKFLPRLFGIPWPLNLLETEHII